jgi:hypothetical protein
MEVSMNLLSGFTQAIDLLVEYKLWSSLICALFTISFLAEWRYRVNRSGETLTLENFQNGILLRCAIWLVFMLLTAIILIHLAVWALL